MLTILISTTVVQINRYSQPLLPFTVTLYCDLITTYILMSTQYHSTFPIFFTSIMNIMNTTNDLFTIRFNWNWENRTNTLIHEFYYWEWGFNGSHNNKFVTLIGILVAWCDEPEPLRWFIYPACEGKGRSNTSFGFDFGVDESTPCWDRFFARGFWTLCVVAA